MHRLRPNLTIPELLKLAGCFRILPRSRLHPPPQQRLAEKGIAGEVREEAVSGSEGHDDLRAVRSRN